VLVRWRIRLRRASTLRLESELSHWEPKSIFLPLFFVECSLRCTDSSSTEARR